MTHIGIDARLVDYRTGGISTYIRRLAETLDSLKPRHRLTLFRSRRATAPRIASFEECPLWTPPHHRLERTALSAELLRYRLDVLHSPDFIPPWRGARQHIITVHDLTFLHYPEHKDADARRYYNDQIETAVQHAAHILAVSKATKDDLITMLNVPADKITVQPHGVDRQFRPLLHDELEPARTRLRLPRRFILHVGTLEPRKNLPALLDAYAGLVDPPALVLAGRVGWLFEETMARIRKMQRDHHPIIVRHDIDDEDLPALYNAASVLVLPSLYEGFGLPALEAMACGTPVVVSDRSSLPEVVGDAGVLVDPEDTAALTAALQRSLDDARWQQTARERGLTRAAQFTWRRSAEIALSVYEKVL
jgi:glycosyltransferase involved in cell wall biosynthesis